MLQSFLSRATLIFLSSTLALLGVACEQKTGSEGSPWRSVPESSQNTSGTISNQNSGENDNLAASSPVKAIAPQTLPASPTPPSEPAINYFELGLDKAMGAWSISQSAQSPDDWQLVVSQYRDAIALMEKVPRHSPEFTIAQAKIYEYRSHVKIARERDIPRPVQSANRGNQGIIVAVPQPQNLGSNYTLTPPASTQQPPVKPISPRSAFIAPIKRRMGGTPIVEVTFNNQQKFEMIVDTGASGTVITQEMANALAVVQVGTVKANTASARTVDFPIGYVDSMAVGGVKVNRVAVAIAGPELETGLLGHDFFGKYDVTIRRDVVEFSPQSRSQVNPVETGLAVTIFPKQNHSEEFP
ncbi:MULTISPECIES: retropepsin-like aspartic protease family protein [Cyanophyceae]|uniref:retropepsin-like aspartic protease family protein n=1 Tax=Cyanophyceae TaxID=3028117 RepID=UPI00232F580E|nr:MULTISPECIES: retropepsin-like aspartic protease [Cyanophyceae]MDB9303717.1 retropepsin-like aspartic protease [Nodularia spumigena CS-591/12]MDB9317450.1 retropepsin-like aspartic protease [Nodularia spumigena CS-590/01A]MDB9324088.1 retropepsin-like aspartic protease [Nodularia spumigena CS-591/07A]MDB9326403.1 retropepsin-like aspartic protease [Nodularia spumigena CS-590/02]MDB9329665.1 retropepsin-like aspartic protease [Nodularia spumigena CS-591/04]